MKSIANNSGPCTAQHCQVEMNTGSLRSFMQDEESEDDYLMDSRDPHSSWMKRGNTTSHDVHHNGGGRTIFVLPTSRKDPRMDVFPSKDASSLRQTPRTTMRGGMIKGKRSLYRRSSTASTAPMSSFLVEEDDHSDKPDEEPPLHQQQDGSVAEAEQSSSSFRLCQEAAHSITWSTTTTAISDECLLQNVHEEANGGDLLPMVLHAVHNRHWNKVQSLLEQEPSMAKRSVMTVIQGENSSALLVHLLCGIKETPVSLVDALVTLHPKSLLQKDERAGRLPIHVAVVRDAHPEMVQYLCQASSKALEVQDQEGNLPLHYAAMHGSAVVLQALLEAYPQGCKIPNSRDRFPLHLVCARCYDTTPLPTRDLEALIHSYPEALLQLDRFGRTPLHLAASVQHPQWQVLQVLIEHAPQVLFYKDKAQKIPLQCAKSGHNRSNDVVVSYLTEATNRERKLRRLVSSWNPLNLGRYRKKEKQETNDLYCCYG